MSVRIITADVMVGLAQMSDESVNCVVTSPPYWGLRDYGCAGQIGLERTFAEYVAKMVEVFCEVRRVLRSDGVCFVNLGDSYNAYNGGAGLGSRLSGRQTTARPKLQSGYGLRDPVLKPKDLIGIPWRVAFALQDDGWYLRGDYVWAKPNPMPESVTDRCTKSHEYVFHLSKSERYWWDQEAILERAEYAGPNSPGSQASPYGQGYTRRAQELKHIGANGNATSFRGGSYVHGEPGPRSVHGNSKGRKAGNKSHKYVDQYEIDEGEQHRTKAGLMKIVDVEWLSRNKRSVWTIATVPFKDAHFATFPPKLVEICVKAGCPVGGMVLDPFGGAGTTGLVADRLQRNATLIELNKDYVEIAERRIGKDRGGLLDIMEGVK